MTDAASGSSLVIDPVLLNNDPEAFRKDLMAQIRARAGTRVVNTKSVFQDLIKQTLEAFLEVEMEEPTRLRQIRTRRPQHSQFA